MIGQVCQVSDQIVLGQINAGELVELSGLVVSQTDPDLFWAHNDSGTAQALHGLDSTGRDLVRASLSQPTKDVEDIAIAGGQLLLADVGDNYGTRQSVALHLVDEPETSNRQQSISPIQSITVVYPDGSHNVEAVFVDPTDGEAFLITKDQPSSDEEHISHPMYQVSLTGTNAEAQLVGHVELPITSNSENEEKFESSDPVSSFVELFAPVLEAPTAADISRDGSIIVVRTYASVWIFQRKPGESVTDVLRSEPCRVTIPNEPQGEAVAIVETSNNQDGTTEVRLVTASEGTASPLTQTTVTVGRA